MKRLNSPVYIRALMITLLYILTWPVNAEEAKELNWDELIPESARNQQALLSNTQIDHSQSTPVKPQQTPDAPIRKDLDGKKIKLPGFIVPLDGNEKAVTEFLLVPYFGACIHTPPPPENQIVYVYYEKGVDIDMLYDPIWIEGPIRAYKTQSDLATSGYSMFADNVVAYEF